MADPKKEREYTPEELRESLSTFDPEAVGDQAPSDPTDPTTSTKGGPMPENTPEQARLDEKAADFRDNIPERERDDRLPHASRGHSSKGS